MGPRTWKPWARSERKSLTAEFSEEALSQRRLRLACQARVRGDVAVSKRGVRPGVTLSAHARLTLGSTTGEPPSSLGQLTVHCHLTLAI